MLLYIQSRNVSIWSKCIDKRFYCCITRYILTNVSLVVWNRYGSLELNGASTWAYTEPAHLHFNLSTLTVQGGAHLAFLSPTSLQTNVQVFSGRLASDKTGTKKLSVCLILQFKLIHQICNT